MAEPTTRNPVSTFTPAMFRGRPVTFVTLVAGIVVFGLFGLMAFAPEPEVRPIGYVMLFFAGLCATKMGFWFLETRSTRLIINDHCTILRRGILSKRTNELRHIDIRQIKVDQSLFQRILNTGNVGLSTAAGADVEVEVVGIPHPNKLKQTIESRRQQS